MQDALSRALYPECVEMRVDAKGCGLHHFGHSVLTLYYCKDYMSPVHRDRDSGFSLALQISKDNQNSGDNTDSGDYDFGYAQYGIRLRTLPGSAW